MPDRILVAGDNQHVASKSTPRELQLEASVLPPTTEHVRVSTPPRSVERTHCCDRSQPKTVFLLLPPVHRSIRLYEHTFPSATDEESLSNSTPTLDGVLDPALASNLSSRTGGEREARGAGTPEAHMQVWI